MLQHYLFYGLLSTKFSKLDYLMEKCNAFCCYEIVHFLLVLSKIWSSNYYIKNACMFNFFLFLKITCGKLTIKISILIIKKILWLIKINDFHWKKKIFYKFLIA